MKKICLLLFLALGHNAFGMQEVSNLAVVPAVQFLPTCTDTLLTGSQPDYIQTIFCELYNFKEALVADRLAYQEWNYALLELTNSFQIHHDQQTAALAQIKDAILQIKQLLTQQEEQGESYLQTINALSEQLYQLQRQTDQEILALQKQLDQTNLELDLLEDEYGEFIDASYAHTQAFYNMLLIAKQEYNALLVERTQFFNALQALTNSLYSQDAQESAQIYDLLATLAPHCN